MSAHRAQGAALPAFTLLAILCVPTRAADYAAWKDTLDVYLDTSPGGIGLAEEVRDFPLLVRLRAPQFPFSRARGAGQDLRFANRQGRHLPHHVERWDSAGGRAEVWVLADTVHGGSSSQHLRMYWNNPAAADTSDPGGVFSAARGLLAAWHLGETGAAPRANAVAGGNPALPAGYEGDEARPGVIALADSLDGDAAGDYLDAGAGYGDFTAGFSYSAWVKPAAVRTWGRLMDFGNGTAADNIIIGRDAGTANLAVHVYAGVGPAHSRLNTPPFLVAGEWQHVAVTIRPSDSLVSAFRNGALAWTGKLAAPIALAPRTGNWLGRSHWTADQYWQGMFDEVRLSRTVDDAARIRLGYESQRPDQALVTFRPPLPGCRPAFAAPADTAVEEGEALHLRAVADCATTFGWSQAGGLPIRILDPASKELPLALPRVAGDTAIVLRFAAELPGGPREALVRVGIREAIPEPRLLLPDSLAWDGRDSLAIRAVIPNLDSVRASRDSLVIFAWTVTGITLDTAQRGSALILRNPSGPGTADIRLCVDNRGPAACRTVRLRVDAPTGMENRRPVPSARPSRVREGRRLDGRLWNSPHRPRRK